MLKDVIGLFPLNPAIQLRSTHLDPYWDMMMLIGASGYSVMMEAVNEDELMVQKQTPVASSPRTTSSDVRESFSVAIMVLVATHV